MLRSYLTLFTLLCLFDLSGQIDSLELNKLTNSADHFYQEGDFKTAKEIYISLDSLFPNDIRTNSRLANIYEQEENTPKALKHYLRLTKLDSLRGKYFRKSARQYLKAGEKNQSLSNYKKAYSLNPKDFLTTKALAEIYISQNDTLSADTLLKQGLVYDSLNVLLLQLYAKNAYKKKNYQEVIRSLEIVKGKVDFNTYYAKLFGFAYLQVDSLENSVRWLTRALADKSDSENVHYYLSEAHKKLGDLTSAKHHLQQAIQQAISSKTGRYYRNLAKIYDDEHNLKDALPAYEEAYRYDQNPLMLFFMARGYDAYYADKSVAVRYYNKYIKSKDENHTYIDYAKERVRSLKEHIHQKVSN